MNNKQRLSCRGLGALAIILLRIGISSTWLINAIGDCYRESTFKGYKCEIGKGHAVMILPT